MCLTGVCMGIKSNLALTQVISPKPNLPRHRCLHPRFVSHAGSAFLGWWHLFWELPLWKSEQGNPKVSFFPLLSATAQIYRQTHKPAVIVDLSWWQASEQNLEERGCSWDIFWPLLFFFLNHIFFLSCNWKAAAREREEDLQRLLTAMAKLNPIITSQYKIKPADSATGGHNIQLLPTRWSQQFKNKIQNLLYSVSLKPHVACGEIGWLRLEYSTLSLQQKQQQCVWRKIQRELTPCKVFACVIQLWRAAHTKNPSYYEVMWTQELLKVRTQKLLITLFHHRNSGCCFQFWPQHWKQLLVSAQPMKFRPPVQGLGTR